MGIEYEQPYSVDADIDPNLSETGDVSWFTKKTDGNQPSHIQDRLHSPYALPPRTALECTSNQPSNNSSPYSPELMRYPQNGRAQANTGPQRPFVIHGSPNYLHYKVGKRPQSGAGEMRSLPSQDVTEVYQYQSQQPRSFRQNWQQVIDLPGLPPKSSPLDLFSYPVDSLRVSPTLQRLEIESVPDITLYRPSEDGKHQIIEHIYLEFCEPLYLDGWNVILGSGEPGQASPPPGSLVVKLYEPILLAFPNQFSGIALNEVEAGLVPSATDVDSLLAFESPRFVKVRQ